MKGKIDAAVDSQDIAKLPTCSYTGWRCFSDRTWDFELVLTDALTQIPGLCTRRDRCYDNCRCNRCWFDN